MGHGKNILDKELDKFTTNGDGETAVRVAGGDTILKDGRISQFVAAGFTDTHTMHLDTGSVNILTAFMLIDLSDTTNWTHSETGHINLEYILLEVDPDSAYLGEVKIGFLSNVNATNGDFNQIIDMDMAKKSELVIEPFNFGSHGFDCETNHHFGPVITDSTLFQTDVDLGGPDDPSTITYPSGDGDLVLLVERSAGTVDVSITIGYESVT